MATIMHSEEPCLFPSLGETEARTSGAETINLVLVESRIDFEPSDRGTVVRNLQLAWAVLLQAFVGCETVSFGITEADIPSTGKDVATLGLGHDFQVINTAISTASYLHEVEFEQAQKSHAEARLVNTGMHIIHASHHQSASPQVIYRDNLPPELDLVLLVELCPDGRTISLLYRSSLLTASNAANASSTFRQIFDAVQVNPGGRIGDIDMISSRDWNAFKVFNSPVRLPPAQCLHTIVETQAQHDGGRICIEAWDGILTYRELDLYSTLVSHDLLGRGAGPGAIIPFCMEKSKWAVVGMIGILKAGAACSPLDPSYPADYLDSAFKSCGSDVVVASRSQDSRFLAGKVLVVDESIFHSVRDAVEPQVVRPHDLAFLMWTSGSTGNPKGVLLDHNALYLSTTAYAEASAFNAATRTFQFTSFTFTASLCDIFGTFAKGGCLCIPSESQRLNDLQDSLKIFRANFTWLTTTSLSGISPEELTELKAVTVGGESMSRDVAARWSQSCRLSISYGTTETAGWCLLNPGLASESNTSILGKPILPLAFVCDKDDHKRPVPVGATGELVLGGPFLSLGYFNDEERTKAQFIEKPPWQAKLNPSYTGRWYKTNDLVRYNANGSISFIGRQQTHAKIRGQRIDLQQVEHIVKEALSTAKDVIVEIVQPDDQTQSPIHVAFVVPSATQTRNGEVIASTVTTPEGLIKQQISESMPKIRASIPTYMVPGAFLSLSAVPLTRTNKTNRRWLREQAASMPRQQLLGIRSTDMDMPPCKSSKEMLFMKGLWSQVLNLPPDNIRSDDNFLQLGGDSYKAIQLASRARREGIALSVKHIIQNPQLSALVNYNNERTDWEIGQRRVNGTDDLGTSLPIEYRLEAARQCGVSFDDIEDLYPCTALQEGLMALSNRRPGSYVNEMMYHIQPGTDLLRFKDSWSRVADSLPVLRTRLVHLDKYGTCQVVLQEPISWITIAGQSECVLQRLASEMSLGSRLVHFVVITDQQTEESRLLLIIHHSLFDRWSAGPLLQRFDSAHGGEPLEKQDFKEFVNYCRHEPGQEADDFWRKYIGEVNYPVFPTLPRDNYLPKSTGTVCKCILLPKHSNSRFTLASKIHLSWALVISRLTGSSNVLFGIVSNGRSAPIEHIDSLVGATLATVPFRVKVNPNLTVDDALDMIQNEAASMLSYEQRGLRNIARLSPHCKAACEFQTLVVVHAATADSRIQPFTGQGAHEDFYTYGLTVSCEPVGADRVVVNAYFDTDVIGERQATLLVHQLEHTLQQMFHDGSTQIKELDGLSIHDRELLRQWARKPETSHTCVGDVIEKACIATPHAEAICSWDGSMTYSELDKWASQLSRSLHGRGVAPGAFVPLLFEKSKWTVVAVLAVVKSGGAFVLLDPSYPLQRLQDICKQLDAKWVLTSSDYAEKAVTLAQEPIVVNDCINQLAHMVTITVTADPSKTSPVDILYAAFTSGSTGRPKGVLVSHMSYCSGATAHLKAWSITSASRVLQFSSYAFDASIVEILSTLMAGACICIPSEFERRNMLAEATTRMKANWAIFTPSMAQSLDPADFPTLERLSIGGEKVAKYEVDKWAPRVNLMQGYGPAECSVNSTVQPSVTIDSDPRNIGLPTGAYCWIVDAENHDCLLPVGGIGELLVGGPIVADGYHADGAKTEAAFIKPPQWLKECELLPQAAGEDSGIHHRLYKTGDLVQYSLELDGSMLYMSRKDTQAKIRGQRLELSEVEHHLRAVMQSIKWQAVQVVAEIISTNEGRSQTLAVAFSSRNPGHASSSSCSPSGVKLFQLTAELRRQCFHCRDALGERLPLFMVPTLWVPLEQIPMTATGKIDRRLIREFLALQPMGALKEFIFNQTSPASGVESHQVPQPPEDESLTGDERELRSLVISVLGQGDDESTPSARMHDKFTAVGGDSVGAIALVAAAKKNRFSFTAIDVFECTLKELSSMKVL